MLIYWLPTPERERSCKNDESVESPRRRTRISSRVASNWGNHVWRSTKFPNLHIRISPSLSESRIFSRSFSRWKNSHHHLIPSSSVGWESGKDLLRGQQRGAPTHPAVGRSVGRSAGRVGTVCWFWPQVRSRRPFSFFRIFVRSASSQSRFTFRSVILVLIQANQVEGGKLHTYRHTYTQSDWQAEWQTY